MSLSDSNPSDLYKKELYKTELCRSWIEGQGKCKYGQRCQYAHGYDELRNIPRHPKYKTEACFSYYFRGFCPYGPRCNFLHDEYQKVYEVDNTLQNIKKMLDTAFPLTNDTELNPNAAVFIPRKDKTTDELESVYAESFMNESVEPRQEMLSDSGCEHNNVSSDTELEPFTSKGFTPAETFFMLQAIYNHPYDIFDNRLDFLSNPFVTVKQDVNNTTRLPIFTQFTSSK